LAARIRYSLCSVDAEARTCPIALEERPWTFSSTSIKIVS
jgi:hypothetical protein